MKSSWLIVVISIFTIGYNFVKFFELTVIKVNFPCPCPCPYLTTKLYSPQETLFTHHRGNGSDNISETNSKSILVSLHQTPPEV